MFTLCFISYLDIIWDQEEMPWLYANTKSFYIKYLAIWGLWYVMESWNKYPHKEYPLLLYDFKT